MRFYLNSDWNDGKAIGALVDNVAPGLCPDWATWDPKDALQNATEAMGLADDWLGVRQLIKPDEMTNPNIDEVRNYIQLLSYAIWIYKFFHSCSDSISNRWWHICLSTQALSLSKAHRFVHVPILIGEIIAQHKHISLFPTFSETFSSCFSLVI